MAKAAPSRVERYQQLIHEVSRQLKVKPSDPRVEHVATLRLMREQLQARLLEGQNVDAADVLKLDEALRTYVPKEQHRINIQYVGTVDRCPKCGYERPASPEPPPKPSPSAIPAAAARTLNVVQLGPRRSGI